MLKSIGNLDIVITDFDTLNNNKNIGKLYLLNQRCLPVLVGESRETICDYLFLRPIEYIDCIGSVDPEDDNNKIKKVCQLFAKIANDGLLNKTDNSIMTLIIGLEISEHKLQNNLCNKSHERTVRNNISIKRI